MRTASIILAGFGSVVAFADSVTPIQIRFDFACDHPTQIVGSAVYVSWEAKNLNSTNHPIVYLPNDAKNAESLLTMVDAQGRPLMSVRAIAASDRLKKAKEIFESTKDPDERLRARTIIWTRGGSAPPRRPFPTTRLCPGQPMTGRWDLAELYPLRSPGAYTLQVGALSDPIEFRGQTNIQIWLKE